MIDEINKRVAANYYLIYGNRHYMDVVGLIDIQENKGLNTYGTTIMEYNGTTKDHIQHALEEAVDLAVYLEKLLFLLEVDPKYSDQSETRILSGLLKSDKKDIYGLLNALLTALNTVS